MNACKLTKQDRGSCQYTLLEHHACAVAASAACANRHRHFYANRVVLHSLAIKSQARRPSCQFWPWLSTYQKYEHKVQALQLDRQAADHLAQRRSLEAAAVAEREAAMNEALRQMIDNEKERLLLDQATRKVCIRSRSTCCCSLSVHHRPSDMRVIHAWLRSIRSVPARKVRPSTLMSCSHACTRCTFAYRNCSVSMSVIACCL